jgi:hypothetical protein
VVQHWLVSSSMRTVTISVGILKFDLLSFENAMLPITILLLKAASLKLTHADCTAKHFESGWREQDRHSRMASSRLPGRLRGSLQRISPNFTEHGGFTVCMDRKATDDRWRWQNPCRSCECVKRGSFALLLHESPPQLAELSPSTSMMVSQTEANVTLRSRCNLRSIPFIVNQQEICHGQGSHISQLIIYRLER